MQRHNEIHEAKDDSHADEENHGRAMGGKDFLKVAGGNETMGIADGKSLLKPHHEGIGKAFEEHDEDDDDVHDADSFRIDSGQPFIPEPFPAFEVKDKADDARCRSTAFMMTAKVLTGFVLESF